MDQPGRVANPASGQPNRKNEYSPVPVRALEFGLARRVQPSRPAVAGKRVNGVFLGRSQSFRYQRRPMDDCSPGREGMAQDGGTRRERFMAKRINTTAEKPGLGYGIQ